MSRTSTQPEPPSREAAVGASQLRNAAPRRGLTAADVGTAAERRSTERPLNHFYLKAVTTMGYGIGGILILILVILAIIYFAKRV